jgi:hypothetical protein
MADWLTTDQYKAWARITDTTDDAAIDQAVTAVMAAVAGRCPRLFITVNPLIEPPPDPPPPPDDVMEASLLWVNRLLARRNSPDGVVGVSDLGTAQILPQDTDIKRLLSPYTAMVVA